MLESVFVYGLLTLIMVFCGVVAARRELLLYNNSDYNDYNIENDENNENDENSDNIDNNKVFYLENERFWRPEILVIIAFFTFVFGCRYGVGVDYFRYLYAYQIGSDREYEWLFRSISNLMSGQGLHFAIFFSLWAFLQITLLLYAFKNYRFIFPYLLLYLIIGNFFMSMMNIIRQQIAALIFLNAIHYIDEKKPIQYYLCILIAYFFHRSAILMVVMYPILRFKDDWFRKVGVQLILLFIAVFLYYRFDLVTRFIQVPFEWVSSNLGFERYRMAILGNEVLDDKSRFGANTGLGVFVLLFKCLPIILLSKPLKEYYQSSFFNMLYSMWFIRVLADFIVGASISLNRPFVYFTDISIAMAAFFTYYCFKSKETGKLLLGIAMIMVYLVMFLFILSNGEINTSKYVFFWQ